jgi:hypothetical protein
LGYVCQTIALYLKSDWIVRANNLPKASQLSSTIFAMPEIPLSERWTENAPFDELKELHKMYRDYMKHEDDLINQRSTWHLLLQGFLFTTLGVIGEWQLPKNGNDPLYTERGFLVFVLAAVGATIAYLSFISIRAANRAIDTLHKKWDDIQGVFEHPAKNLLPEIAGGGGRNAKRDGKRPAMLIPVFIAIAWVLIFGMAVIDRVRPLPSKPPTAITNSDHTPPSGVSDPQASPPARQH